MDSKGKDVRMRVTRDPEQFLLFSKRRISKSYRVISDQDFHEKILVKYSRSFYFIRFPLSFLSFPIRLAHIFNNVFSLAVHVNNISLPFVYSGVLKGLMSFSLVGSTPQAPQVRSFALLGNYLSRATPFLRMAREYIFRAEKAVFFESLPGGARHFSLRDKPSVSRTESSQFSTLAKFIRISSIHDRLRSLLRYGFIEVPTPSQPTKIGFLSGQAGFSGLTHFIRSQREIAQVLSNRQISLFGRHRLAEVPIRLFHSFGPTSDFTFRDRKGIERYLSETKSTQFSALAGLSHLLSVYDRLMTFLKPAFIADIPSGRAFLLGLLSGKIGPLGIIHYIRSQKRFFSVLTKGEINLWERKGLAGVPGTLFASSFGTAREYISRERKTQIFKSSIERRDIERYLAASESIQFSTGTKFFYSALIHDRIRPLLKSSFIRFPILSSQGQARHLTKGGIPRLAWQFGSALERTGGIFPLPETIFSDYTGRAEGAEDLSHPLTRSGLMLRSYGAETKDTHPESTSLFKHRAYTGEALLSKKIVYTKRSSEVLNFEAIRREKEKILRFKEYVDGEGALEKLDLVTHPLSTSNFISSNAPSSAYGPRLPEMVHYSADKFPGYPTVSKLDDVKRKEHFIDSHKRDIPKPFAVPETTISGIADRVYDIILDRVKRERAMRGR